MLITLAELSVSIRVITYPSTILSQILLNHIYTLGPRIFHFGLLILVCRIIKLLFLVSLPGARGAGRRL